MIYWGIIAALLSAASWAFGTVVFDRIGKIVPYVGITFLKGIFSIILMVALLMFTGGLQTIGKRDFFFLVLSGIIGISIGDSLFFKSLQDLGAKVQVIFFLLGQIFTMILSLLLLGEVLSPEQYAGAMILLAGIVIGGKQTDHPNKIRGIICGLLSILCFSASVIMVKIAIADVEVVTATFYRMVFGTIFTLGFGVVGKQLFSWISPLRNKRILSLFILNVFVITYGGFLLSMVAIKFITVSLTSVLGTTEPVFVLLFAYLINKEKTSRQEIIGTLITLVGLLMIINGE